MDKVSQNLGNAAIKGIGAKTASIIDVARYIEAHSDETLTLAILAKKHKLSSTQLQKSFNAIFGISPKVFQDGIRQQRFKSMLQDGESVTDALYRAGYGSSSRVYEKSSTQMGMTPGVYKGGAVDESIDYACHKTRFGYLLIAATDKGVCFAMFDKQASRLLSMLKIEFPNASTQPSKGGVLVEQWFTQIEQYLLAKQPLPELPLDLRGTAFQLSVWKFLRSIPAGVPVSYRDVAIGIDKPKAFRAAASACAKNRVALLVPCHRVLRGDGGLGGYRWGVDVKHALLEIENSIAATDTKKASQ